MWTTENMPDLSGKTAIVTGANTGIGYETALALYKSGAHVVLACRSMDNAKQALAQMEREDGKGRLEAALLDLASLDGVKQFAAAFMQQHGQLHILINNAGLMIPPEGKTADGFELQFGVNHLGHFALTGRLYSLLKATPGARIVTVSSLAYLPGKIDFDNLRSEKDYDPQREYRQSKLANLLFAIELQRRIETTGDRVISMAAQPGANRTSLIRSMNEEELAAAIARVGGLMEPWQGALPSLYAAVSPDALGGRLYGPDKDGGYRGYPAEAIIAPHALDAALAEKLWAFSEEVTGIYFPE